MSAEIKSIHLKKYGVNCYLVNTSGNFVLIDTGASQSRAELERELAEAGCRPGNLKLIVLTHGDYDHTGNCRYLRSKYQAKIAMHQADSGMVERGDMLWNRKVNIITRALARVAFLFIGLSKSERFKPDLTLDEGFDLSGYGIEAKVLHIPGHSRGSIGILTSGGDLFCGDLLICGEQPRKNSLIFDSAAADASIARLKSLHVNTVYPGHGPSFPMSSLA